MTTTYGYSPTRNGVTLRVAATVNGGTVTIAPTLTATVPIYEASNSCAWSGAASGSYGGVSIYVGSPSGGRTVSNAPIKVSSSATSFSFNVAQTTSPQTKTLTFSLYGVDYAGQTLTATVTFVIPALAPATPSGGSASAAYLSGGQWRTNLAWSLPAGATGVQLWRWDNTRTDLSYVNIQNLGAVSSYTDTIALDRTYGYAVVATNSGGASGWHFFGNVHTKPHAPSSLTAARSGTSVVGSFVNQSTLNPAFEIVDSTDDGATWSAPVLTIARNDYAVGDTIEYTLSGLNATLPHRIRVRAIGEDPTPTGTVGDWTAPSAPVVIITKPNPPYGLTAGVRAWSSALVLEASPSTRVLPDGSALEAFEWRHRARGTTAWTEVINNAPDMLALAVSEYAAQTEVEHQVRVKGAHADWSDWSAVAVVKLSSLPVSSFIDPDNGSTLQGDILTVQVAGHDPDGGQITAARYWLEDTGGRTLAARVETTQQLTSWTYPVKLNDGQQVVAWTQHRKADGLWSQPVSITVTVAYIGPAELDVTTRWDTRRALLVFEWESLVDPTKPAPVSVDVYTLRDGQRLEVAAGLPPMGAWPMRLAPLVDTVYMLAIRSALPSTTWQTVVVPVDPQLAGRFVVNGGPGYSLAAIGEYNVDLTRDGGRDRELVTGWANSPYGREVVKEALSDTRSLGFDTYDDINSAEDFHAVQSQPHALWYRDPTGASWACSMTKPTRSLSRRANKVHVSFNVSRIGGGPGLDEAIEDGLQTADTIYADLIPEV